MVTVWRIGGQSGVTFWSQCGELVDSQGSHGHNVGNSLVETQG